MVNRMCGSLVLPELLPPSTASCQSRGTPRPRLLPWFSLPGQAIFEAKRLFLLSICHL